jgi:hypothetical protein
VCFYPMTALYAEVEAAIVLFGRAEKAFDGD